MLGPDGQILLVHRRAKQHANVRFWPKAHLVHRTCPLSGVKRTLAQKMDYGPIVPGDR